MKQRLSPLVLLFLAMLLALTPQRAEAAGASLTGTGSLRPGDSVTLTFSVSGSGVYAVDTDLRYDTATLELLSYKALPTGWKMDRKATGGFLLEDPTMSRPVEGTTHLFSLTLRVKTDAPAGSTASVTVSNIKVSGEESSAALGSASWSASVLPPLSGDATLKSLSCTGADLTFTGGTEYHLTVPYETAVLKLQYTAAHSGAKVAVSGTNLAVGSNTVTVTVTAENGAVKRYYLYVTRAQDPNYVPSNDATLASLQVSSGTLSPAFDPAVTEYAVYLPYEVQTLTLKGTARSDKAQSVLQVGEETLSEGETLLLMRCVAEDGTVKDYRVHAVRMPLFTGVLPEITAPAPGTPLPDIPADTPAPAPDTDRITLPLTVTLPLVGAVPLRTAALAGIIAAALVLVLLLVLCWTLGRRSAMRRDPSRTGGAAKAPAAGPAAPPAEEPAPLPAAEPEPQPEPQPQDLSLDDLLEDIRNM